MNAGINRREALAGLTLTAAAGTVAAPALPSSIGRREWDVAMAALKEAERKSAALEGRVDAINAAYRKELSAIPQVASEWDIRHARGAYRQVSYLEDLGDNYDRYRGYHALIQADGARKAKVAALDQRLGWTAINDRYEAISEEICAAQAVLLAMPAPDGEALMWKVQQLYTPGDGIWEADYEQQTHADLRRFLLNGRA